ncbi:recq-mediated genome instability protein 1 [Phtheirospermum japonicum]|uniref:RecQ-mediated genome instability protein 1 n=1 Tax=Phtheirospermum japonicum TaxID=374723 RepID=A0A830BHH7_9LAMI|nr:recq-mediated genome instability protein 1 [Phtheirospermum japonicum]
MSRRRLRLVCSSDEEDEAPPPPPPPPPPPQPQQQQYEEIEDIILDDIETDFQTVTLNSSNPTPSSNYSTTNRNGSRIDEAIPLDISDEDEENVVISEVTNNSSSDNVNGNNSYFPVSESPVNGVLERLGLRLKKEWLDSCLQRLQSSVMGFQRMDDSAKAKLCFEQFLISDMNYCGAGVLPRNVHTLGLVDLKGPFVLQVDEIVNISCPLRRRYHNAAPGKGRCLKLSMTDGVQRVFGMEYRPINDLQPLSPAGLKVAVCNVNIRHGLLMLVPEVLQVLGGSVEELESARQRLVNEINKPPRGKRNTMVPPLAARATLAAWPPPNNGVPGHVDRNTSVNTTPQHATTQGTAAGISANQQATATPVGRNNAHLNSSAAQEHNEVPRRTDMPANIPSRVTGQGAAFGVPCIGRPRESFRVPMRSNDKPSRLHDVQPVERVTISHDNNETLRETRQVSRHNDEPNRSSVLPMDMDVEEIFMVDNLERHYVLSRNEDIPFTYLASLSAKCTAIIDEDSVVRGKIKCFLTGVKGFQYKQRPKYELRVYVDDGSLISEILIDHSAVQSRVGCSPQEVTSALESVESERVNAMKETLKQFQKFLINFEGTMVVEINKASPVPVAVEMNQGCAASDACLLLRRLKPLSSRSQSQNVSHLNPINLSP